MHHGGVPPSGGAGSPVAGARLVRVLAVPEVMDPVQGQMQGRLEQVVGMIRRWVLIEPGHDGRVVGRCVGEGRSGQPPSGGVGQGADGPDLVENRPVVGRIDDHAHVSVVLGRCPDHGRTADVNQLDPGVRRERVEIPNHQIDGHDAPGFQVGQVPGIGSVGQDPTVNRRVQRLNPAPKNLRGPGDLADLHHGHALVGQNRGRTPAGNQLPARFDKTACQVCDTSLVMDR